VAAALRTGIGSHRVSEQNALTRPATNEMLARMVLRAGFSVRAASLAARFLGVWAMAAGCSAGQVQQALDLPPPDPAPRATPPAVRAEPIQPLATETAPPPVKVRLRFERERADETLHIALDAPPHVAALGRQSVFVHDRKGWREEPLPPAVREALELRLTVFYGRDFRVRVVGTHQGPKGTESIYLRSLPGGLKPAPDELGRLGNTRTGALVAVLGTADPEVVCRPGDLCLVKRLSGWTRLPAPEDLVRVAIAGGVGYAIGGKQVLREEGKEWMAVGPPGPWEEAGQLSVTGSEVYVLEPARRLIHHLRSSGWSSRESPVGAPSAVWGATPDALWLVGQRGVAYFDGHRWMLVESAPPDTSTVLGRSAEDVWFGGRSGLFRIVGKPEIVE